MDVGEFFTAFIDKKWEKDKAYDLGHFSSVYSIRQNVAQYYLRKAVYDGRLCCVKVKNKSYYMLAQWRDNFKVFEDKLEFVKVL
jgi:DTW domain-containing protein YfiP